MPASPLSMDITAAAGARAVPFLRRQLRRAHQLLKPPLRQLSLALVGDRRMAELHAQFLGIRGPTDVLTFPLEADKRGRTISGEVVVCVPEARRRARELGVGVERELLLYALHGMLHLCGYDDRTPAAYRTMHRTEDQILTKLGVGPLFSRAQSPRRPEAPSRRRRTRSNRSPATGAR
jgi:probable rRNA maturation factor